MDNLRENFRNWLTKQGLSEKTETGRPSTIYDYLTTIKRICKKEGYITWEELAINLFSISSNYQGKYKTVLHKYNAFLFEAELSKRVIQQRYNNLLYAYSKLSVERKKCIEEREYITSQELADILKVDIRQIKRWRENRISLHKEDQVEENARGLKQIGPKFVQVGGLYRYYKDDLEKYFHRPIDKM